MAAAAGTETLQARLAALNGSRRPRRLGRRLLVYGAALLVFVFCAGPVALTLVGSVLPDQAMFSFPPRWFSEGMMLDNYAYTFFGTIPRQYAEYESGGRLTQVAKQIPRGLLNSSVVALWVMLANIAIGSPAAYAFARMDFRGKRLTFVAIIMSRLVPAVTLATPFYLLVQAFGLLGTKLAVVMVHTVLTIPFTVLILTVFFRRIPVEVEEAAAIDGCGRLQSFLHVSVPLSAPSVMATGLFAFMLSYAEFLFALVLSGGDASNRALSVAMAALARNFWVSWGLLNTGAFLTLLPTLILVVVVWKAVIERVLDAATAR